MDLQESCIRIIAGNFDRYSAFSKSDDANLKRKLEFLQRVYSFEILSQLSDSNMLRMEYIDLLVNKYLKKLYTNWLRGCPWETVAAKFAEIGSNLHKVYFLEYTKELRPWQNVIHHLTSLEVFSFPCYCTDEILKRVIKSCPKIVEINISHSSSVTNEGIKYLCMKENGKLLCPKLKKVFIRSFGVLDESVEYLIQNFKSLEVIVYINLPTLLYSLHQNDLSSLNTIEPYNLTSLNLLPILPVLRRNTNLLKVCLSVCPFLKSLCCFVSNENILALLSSPLELEELYLRSFSNTRIDVTDLIRGKGQKLTSLIVTQCSLSVAALSESCPSLKQLSLNRVTFKNDFNITPSFKYLETCFFYFKRYDSATAESVSLLLKYSPKLEHIGFKECDLSPSELRTEILKCCECCPIKKVNFAGSVLDKNFIKDILISCRSLKKFLLDEVCIDLDEEFGFKFDYHDDNDDYCYEYDFDNWAYDW